MIKVALIGLGGMGSVHYEAYKTSQKCKLIAVADINHDKTVEKVGEDNVKIYDTLDDVLANENPDMIDICVPSYLHPELSIKALKSGKHVLCEKPVALSKKDAEKVMAVAKENGKLFMTAHVVRFMNAYVYLRNIIESGELGKLIRLDLKRISTLPRWSVGNWMCDLEKSGGTPIDLAIHDIDYVQSIFGKNPEKLHATYKKLNNDNDFFLTEMEYDGAVITTEATWYNAEVDFNASYFAVFQNGYVENNSGNVNKNGENIDFADSEEQTQNVGLNISASDGYKGEIEYFLSCIENSTPPQIVTPQSTVDTMELVEKLLNA